MDDLLVNVSQAAYMLGVCPQTVRAYEVRGFLPCAIERARGKHRRYKLSDVRKLKAFLIEIGEK